MAAAPAYYGGPVLFLVLSIVLVLLACAIVANARARQQLEDLSRAPQDVRRAEHRDDPPSSTGYRGGVG